MKKIQKYLSLLLAACMIFGMLPALAASAADAADPVSVKIDAPEIVPLYKDESYSYAERAVDLVSRMTEEEMIGQTAGYNSPAISRLGVATYMWWNEALHGYNQEGWFGIQTDGSSFPSSYSMGASWDPDIYYQEAVQIGAEIRERVKNNRYNLTMFSPTINLGRDPRWGRNDEGYGEDPFVTGLLASSFVNGVEGKTMDGEFIRKNANGEGVKQAGTTIKHYAANNSEKNRYTSGADNVTVREMREYYTRAARIVTKNADVSSVMMAYSSVSGVPISFSSYYMDTLLRQSYGFSGYIVSDCDSVAVSYNRSVHKNNPHTNANYTLGEGFANALANGLDLQCNAGETDNLGSYASNYEKLKAEADGGPVVTDKGYFTKQQAEVSVARLMTQRMKLGEFDENNFYADEGKARLDAGNGGNYVNGVAGQTQERIDLADDLSRATIVLLQNEDKALPITAEEIDAAADGYDVAIVGPVGQSNFRGGYSSTLRNEANVVTIEQAIRTAFADSSYYPQATVDNTNVNYYYGFSSSVNRNSFTRLQSSQIDVSQVAEDLDLAIVVVGQGSGDSREDGDRLDLALQQAQIDMLNAVKAKNPKKLILVMETYGPVQMVSDLTEGVDAILWSGFNGFRKGTGFGEAITGKNNPSGRMNATWLKDMINDTPGFFDYSLFPVNGNGGRTYMYNVEDTIYPFGFGLSYSDFAYAANGSMLGAARKGGLTLGTASAPITGDSTIDVKFQIKNNSAIPGKQVAQVYAVSPGAGTNNYPLKRLVGFDKVEVGANATVDVTIPVSVKDLAFFDETKDCYELPAGTWQLWVAFSSDLNEATDLVENFTVQNGAIREDPAIVSVKLTQPGDAEKGISERVIFSLSSDAAKNVIIPSLGVTMANEKLYGTRVVNNVPGVDIGVDAAAATAAGNGFANPDTAASLPRLEAGKSADELPHIGEKFTLPSSYQVEYTSNRPAVVAVENGQLVMKGQGVATLTAKVTGPSGVSASEEFTVCVKVEPGLEAVAIGQTKYKKFTPENYEINVTVPKGTAPDNAGLAVNATPVEGATVEYLSKNEAGEFVPNESGKPRAIPDTVYIKVTGDELMEQIYTVNYIEGEAVKPSGGYVLASEVVPGGTYVIVADDTYALNCEAGDGSIGSTEVTVADGKIVGNVSEDMLWTFETPEGVNPASDGQDLYLLNNYEGLSLRRGSQSAPMSLAEFDSGSSNYFCWSLIEREDEDEGYTLYVNGSSRYAATGAETGFTVARVSSSSGNIKTAGSGIKLYELSAPSLPNIDFTTAADAGKYEIANPVQSEVEEGVGLALITTRPAFEDCNGQNTGDQATTPEDVVIVPVSGDWTATLETEFDTNSARNGYYQFFGFYAAQGDDYQNMAGIRGGDGAMQDFLRVGGSITADTDGVKNAPGFDTAGKTYFLQLVKEGDTYTCYRSDDGEDFAEMFAYESTGIEADKIVIDAYTGMTAGYKFTLKSLTFGEGSVTPGPKVDKAALEAAIAEAGAIDKTAYTEASVADLDAAVAAAEAIRDKADATQEEVDDAAQAVRDAIAALIKVDNANTAELEAAIAAAEAVNRDLYTDESLANLDAKLAEARTALAESRLQAVIDTAAQALRDAIDALEPKSTEPGELKLGPNVIKDPESPTGYTVKFLYDNPTASSVTFNGDILLRDDVNRGGNETFTPAQYRPGLMRAGGWNAPMEKKTFTIDGEEKEVWYIEVPLACGANQYWFTLPGSSTMIPDPANTPIWSPTAQQKNGYNYVYVPYDEKQDYAPMKAREAELPRKDGKVGTWGYVPIEIGGRTHHMGVYTPYGYQPKGAKAAGGPYKLIFVLHGYGQDESDWMNIGSVQKIMDNLAAEGRTEPAIIVSVTTNNNMIGGQGDNYSNLMNVILPYLEENYNITDDPMDRAFVGLSMGSMNTQNIINGGADRFGYFGPLSGGMRVNATAPGLDKTHIMFGSGWSDTTVRPDATAHLTLKNAGYFVEYEEVTGGHDFNAWCQLFRIFCEKYAWNPAAFGDGEAPEVDYTALEAAIADAEKIDKTKYTDATVAAFEEALAAAKAALEAEKQTQVDAAEAALKAAIAALKPIDGPNPPAGKYTLTDEIIPGANYIIVADGAYALNALDGGSTGATAVTVEGDKITSEVTAGMVWSFEEAEGVEAALDGSDLYFIFSSDDQYLRRNSGTLALGDNSGETRYFTWSLTEREADDGFTLYLNGNSSGASSRYALSGAETGFTVARVSNSSGNIKTAGSSIRLYTDGEVCEHEWTTEVVEPTCTEGGYTTMTCSKCGRVKTTDKVPALGHDWKEGEILIAPTATEFGKQELICARCGEKTTKTLLPTELTEGPTLVADPDSPTGYTARFVYKNDTDQQVYFNGDIGLRNDADRTDTKDYTPFEYRPGLMRGTGFKTEMENLGGGYWYYEVPLCCGANQYWFTVGSSDTMLPDPANTPIWSPTAQQKNAYNYLYVPYDEKQDYEVLKMREAENPRTDGKVGTWSYVPIQIGGATQHIGVYLPYGYDAERAEPYKTIWILHGGGQDECDWMNIGSVQKIMDNLAAEGRTEPAVIVSPTTNSNQLGSTSDAYANLFNVVLPFVEENYNVSKDKMDRAFGGLSMGSMNTQNIINAQTDAEKFGYYGPWSGGVSVNAGVPGIEYAHILFAGGSNDFGWSASAGQSVENLIAQGVYAKYMTVTGAHDFNTWCQMFRIWCEDYLWNPAAFGDGEPEEVDTTALEAAVAAAKAIDKAEYTDESVAAMDAAVEAAEAVLADENATQKDVDKAAAAVNNAVDALVKKGAEPEVNREALDAAIAAAEALKEADYTPETYKAVKDALEAAKAVPADADQAAVDAAAKALGDAIAALEPAAGKADKRELAKAIGAAEAIDPEKYESVEDLNKALEAAKAVNDKDDATQDEVDAAAKAVNDAIAALKEKEPPVEEPFRFDDVKNEKSFYFKPVYWAYEAKPQITNGMTPTTFVPDGGCTRGQVVTFLWRAAGCPEPKSTDTPFTDVKAKAFYAKAVAWAVENGITKGMTDTTFEPDTTCTRGQIVTFLYRFKESPAPKSTETPFTDVNPKAFYAKAVAWAVEEGVTKGMTDTTFAPNDTCTRGQIVTFLYRAMGGK